MYMRDVVEAAHVFFKLMEKFCNGSVVVQDKNKKSRKKSKSTKKTSKKSRQSGAGTDAELVSDFGVESKFQRIYMRQLRNRFLWYT